MRKQVSKTAWTKVSAGFVVGSNGVIVRAHQERRVVVTVEHRGVS